MLRTMGIAAAAFLGAFGAQAATYNFEYTTATTGQVLTAVFDADEHTPGTLTLNAISDVMLNGTPFGPIGYISTNGAFLGTTPPAPGTIDLDLSEIDFFACETATCDDGFLFLRNASLPDGMFRASFTDPNTPLNSEISLEIAPVPLPAAGLLLLAGMGALGAMARRRT